MLCEQQAGAGEQGGIQTAPCGTSAYRQMLPGPGEQLLDFVIVELMEIVADLARFPCEPPQWLAWPAQAAIVSRLWLRLVRNMETERTKAISVK